MKLTLKPLCLFFFCWTTGLTAVAAEHTQEDEDQARIELFEFYRENFADLSASKSHIQQEFARFHKDAQVYWQHEELVEAYVQANKALKEVTHSRKCPTISQISFRPLNEEEKREEERQAWHRFELQCGVESAIKNLKDAGYLQYLHNYYFQKPREWTTLENAKLELKLHRTQILSLYKKSH